MAAASPSGGGACFYVDEEGTLRAVNAEDAGGEEDQQQKCQDLPDADQQRQQERNNGQTVRGGGLPHWIRSL